MFRALCPQGLQGGGFGDVTPVLAARPCSIPAPPRASCVIPAMHSLQNIQTQHLPQPLSQGSGGPCHFWGLMVDKPPCVAQGRALCIAGCVSPLALMGSGSHQLSGTLSCLEGPHSHPKAGGSFKLIACIVLERTS